MALQARHPDLPVMVMSALAEGADRLVAEEAHALGIPLIVPLPFAAELYEQDFQSGASRDAFRELCSSAEVIELPLLPGDTAETIRDHGGRRDAHYARLGIFICAHCHVLLALWDGKPSAQLGGTAQVVDFHHWDVMPGFTAGTENQPQVLAEDESDLVYHIVVSRDRPDGTPADGLAPLDEAWFTTDETRPRSRELPAVYAQVFGRMAEFNRDVLAHRDRIRTQGWSLLSAGTPDTVVPAIEPIDTIFTAADWLAVHFQVRVTRALRTIYTLAAFMGLAFIAYTDLDGQDAMAYLFLAFFLGGVLVHRLAERRAWHRKYLDYRALAEGLRVQCYWVAAGVTAGRNSKFAHDNFLQKQDAELGWIRNVMRYTGRLSDVVAPNPEGLQFAVNEWVGEAHSGQGQLAYYERKARERTKLSRITRAIGGTCLWTGIAVTVLLVVFGREFSPDTRSLLIVLMGVLPLVAAVREAYAQKRAEKELIKQYLFMAKIFRNAHRRLDAAASDPVRRQVLKALGDAALEEHSQWLLMHRERPLDHGRMA